MEFTKLDGVSDEGAVMIVRHPADGEPTDATIRLAGTDSKAWRRAAHDMNRRALEGAKSPGDVTGRALKEIEASKADLLASVTLGWENVELDGAALPCTRASAARLYKRFRWLLEQVNQFVGDRSNFFRRDERGPADGDAPESDVVAAAEGSKV